jgi:hypothetical protein
MHAIPFANSSEYNEVPRTKVKSQEFERAKESFILPIINPLVIPKASIKV